MSKKSLEKQRQMMVHNSNTSVQDEGSTGSLVSMLVQYIVHRRRKKKTQSHNLIKFHFNFISAFCSPFSVYLASLQPSQPVNVTQCTSHPFNAHPLKPSHSAASCSASSGEPTEDPLGRWSGACMPHVSVGAGRRPSLDSCIVTEGLLRQPWPLVPLQRNCRSLGEKTFTRRWRGQIWCDVRDSIAAFAVLKYDRSQSQTSLCVHVSFCQSSPPSSSLPQTSFYLSNSTALFDSASVPQQLDMSQSRTNCQTFLDDAMLH